MTEMVKRVARALCYGDPDEQTPMPVHHEDGSLSVSFDSPITVAAWTLHVKMARCVIEAMLEPTFEMALRGGMAGQIFTDEADTGDYVDSGRQCWGSMIQAALSEGQNK